MLSTKSIWNIFEPDHPMSLYFKQVVRSDSSRRTEFGIIIYIPGINNLDKYRFIKQSMFRTYKSFILKYLCEVNNVPYLNVHSTWLVFRNKWYNDSIIKRKDIIRYNMHDCTHNLEFCKALDLINQIFCLSYCSSSWIRCVLLYNTIAMATPWICRNTPGKWI